MKLFKALVFAVAMLTILVAAAQDKSIDLSYSSPLLVQKGPVEVNLADFVAYLDHRVPPEDQRAVLASAARIESILENVALTEAFWMRATESGMMEDPFFRARLYQAAAREARDVYRATLQNEIELDSYEAQAREMFLVEPERFQKRQTIDMEHILVSVTDNQDEVDAMKRIIEAHDRLMAGEDFVEVAEELSDDPTFADNQGMLEDLEVASLVPSVASAVDSLEIDEYSDPIQSRFGWHIIRITAINDAGQMTWEEAKPVAERLARDQHLSEAFERILREINRPPMEFAPGAVQTIFDHYGIDGFGLPELGERSQSDQSAQ